ncbi:hypothetical protein, partial [Rhodococcus olei]|uniref:hypothetical protein n=1 Tax=Rhodococcus olei TaxID=2161675 RepID=UPI0031E90CDD
MNVVVTVTGTHRAELRRVDRGGRRFLVCIGSDANNGDIRNRFTVRIGSSIMKLEVLRAVVCGGAAVSLLVFAPEVAS